MAAEILASSLINTVRFRVDFSSYRQAIKAISKVRDEMKKLNNQTAGLGAGNLGSSRSTVRAARRQAADIHNAQVEEFRRRQKQQGGVQNRIEAKTSAFNFESQRMTRLKPNEIAQYSARVKLLNDQYRAGSLPLIQYNERMRQLTNSMRNQNAQSLTLIERLRSVRSQLLFAGLTGGMALKGIADTGKDLENTGIMMSTVFGDQVGPQMQFLRDQSNRLGISFKDSAKNFSQMMFAGQQAGMGMGDMQDIFLGITEASKVFGMSQDETAGSMRAIIQMFS